ncbi:MAG TPA: polysaccharide biosynthesis tyrosine autokinase [Marmoricola sp.]|nr:polysaccharide biosynthesis tyrosine autokinase [Marmoricola sp.]
MLIVLAALLGATAFNLTQPKVYAANSTGFVTTIGSNDNPALGSVNDTLAKSRATSYVVIAEGRATAAEVIRTEHLDTTPQALIGRIDVVQPTDTVLLNITARASTPQGAKSLANAWVHALADQVQRIEDPQGKRKPGTLEVVPIEAAALPTAPVSPQITRNLLLGLVLGLLLGFAYAVLRSRLDRRLRSIQEVEARYGVNVLGSIPLTDDLAHGPHERAAIAVESHAGESGAAEAFRKLRTNLRFMDVDQPPRVIVVTSPQPGDGKSTIAANLAAAVALAEHPCVLVDGDLRRPSVAESFGLVEGVGLTDVLAGEARVDEVLQEVVGLPHLRVLASGSVPPNPSELLGSQSMRHLLRTMAEKATVIVDAPPLLPVTDAAVLTAVADGAFVVISTGRSRDQDLEAALSHLASANGRPLGVIFNRVAKRSQEAGYYRSSYYRSETAPEQNGRGEHVNREPETVPGRRRAR